MLGEVASVRWSMYHYMTFEFEWLASEYCHIWIGCFKAKIDKPRHPSGVWFFTLGYQSWATSESYLSLSDSVDASLAILVGEPQRSCLNFKKQIKRREGATDADGNLFWESKKSSHPRVSGMIVGNPVVFAELNILEKVLRSSMSAHRSPLRL